MFECLEDIGEIAAQITLDDLALYGVPQFLVRQLISQDNEYDSLWLDGDFHDGGVS